MRRASLHVGQAFQPDRGSQAGKPDLQFRPLYPAPPVGDKASLVVRVYLSILDVSKQSPFPRV
jgi:hypothetical protein